MAQTRKRGLHHQGPILYQDNIPGFQAQAPDGEMEQPNSQATFTSLLTKTHVQHALIQQDGRHNDLPTVGHSICHIGNETSALLTPDPGPGHVVVPGRQGGGAAGRLRDRECKSGGVDAISEKHYGRDRPDAVSGRCPVTMRPLSHFYMCL